MATYKTPGVYIEEISKLPPSVAEVETAVPAFIGYTDRAEYQGKSLLNEPTKIRSLLEYEERFGGGQGFDTVTVTVDASKGGAITVKLAQRFYMYEALRLFFDNGGGKCYIVSVGSYGPGKIESGDENSPGASPGLRVGLKRLEKYDEPTIILFPDAVALTEPELFGLQQLALTQCARLQDRVGLFDLPETVGWNKAVADFRDNIGINDLKYGAAYTPWLRSSYARDVDLRWFSKTIVDENDNPLKLEKLSTDTKLNELAQAALDALSDYQTVENSVKALHGNDFPTIADRYASLKRAVATADDDDKEKAFGDVLKALHGVAVGFASQWATAFDKRAMRKELEAYAKGTLGPALVGIIKLEKSALFKAHSGNDDAAVTAAYAGLDATKILGEGTTSATIVGAALAPAAGASAADVIDEALKKLDPLVLGPDKSLVAFVNQMRAAAQRQRRVVQDALFERHPLVASIVSAIKKRLAEVPPSGAVAGVYSAVDRTRGVWKAPANVSLASVLEPMEQIDFFEQEELNVDVTGGKSINAIRTFTGLGTLVWGARTLAGNDNEWRYVPVRRFFNMVEESVKKSTNWAVFEPNDANLWTKVKGMIENYLIQKWRDGALQGATPDKAFFVKIGLGETMTAQDILEGRLNVEIGMAVVRPAEFIILKFSHKMPEA